jgi:hypothetical protein
MHVRALIRGAVVFLTTSFAFAQEASLIDSVDRTRHLDLDAVDELGMLGRR